MKGPQESTKWEVFNTLRSSSGGPVENEFASFICRAATRLPFARISVATANVRTNVDSLETQQWSGESRNVESVSTRHWIEAADNTRREYVFRGYGDDSILQTVHLKDTRLLPQRVIDSFFSRFFPLGYPNSVSEGYLVYSQYRAVQHFASAILSVLSTQSLLFAAGLRPTPAQATIVSWVLKDGMQHIGKLVCSSMGARMDSEPKRWRIFGMFPVSFTTCGGITAIVFVNHESGAKIAQKRITAQGLSGFGIDNSVFSSADVMYDLGAGLEVVSPLVPQHFLTVAGLANMAKGMALVSARATRLPVYSSFAKEGNLSDLYAKGEAISTLSNVFGLGVGIQLASTVCSTMQGKLLVTPILSAIHLYSVAQEMRAAPINTLNAQRTAMLVGDFLKTGSVSMPADLRYRERLILPVVLHEESGNVRVGAPLLRTVGKPSTLQQLKNQFQSERFLLNFSDKRTDLVLHQSATGEDAVRGWLLAAFAYQLARKSEQTIFSEETLKPNGFGLMKAAALSDAYEQTEKALPSLLKGLRDNGWLTHLFLEGSGYRAVW